MKAKEIAEKIYNDEYYKGKAEQAIKDYALEAVERACNDESLPEHRKETEGEWWSRQMICDNILDRVKKLIKEK